MTASTPQETTALVTAQQSSSLMLSAPMMDQMMAVARAMSEATITVPQHFRGKPGDCLAVVMQATQWNMNPFAVAQKTHIVNGNLGYEAQLVNAVLQATGATDGTFKYEYRGEGNSLECRVGAVCAGDREITWGEWLSISSVTTKNSPLWKTNPKQQMGYLQVKNWARAFKPGAILGVYTTDELEAIPVTERNMGAAEVVGAPAPAPAPEKKTTPWADRDFKEAMPSWQRAINKGKTPQEILDAVALRNPELHLTEQQKAQILSLKKQVIDNVTDAQPKAESKADGLGEKSVQSAIDAANDEDALNTAASQIELVTDADARKRLNAAYDKRLSEIRGAN